MWGRLISWLLSFLTALFNGFGFYEPAYKPYVGNASYEVQQEAVDYAEMRSWYIDSYVGSGDLCKVERHANDTGALNNLGFCYFIAGVDNNPDAINEVHDGDVIIAPTRCRVMSNPDTSTNKLVVQNDSGDYSAFKMEITNPGRWFCCADMESSESGTYMHSITDHKIELSQGDTICIAGPSTTVRFWSSDENGVLKEVETIREFLKYDVTEKGDSTKPAGGSGSGSELDQYLWTGNMTWNADASHSVRRNGAEYTGWWVGVSGEGNWAKDNTVLYNNQYYYIDDEGYMVRGWQEIGSNEYYFYWGDQGSGHPDGSMARNTIVENSNGGSKYVYVNNDGVRDLENGPAGTTVVGVNTYQRTSDGYYTLVRNSGS